MPIYLEINGVRGDVEAENFAGCISVNSLQFDVNRDLSSARPTDQEPVPDPFVSEIQLIRKSDAMSAALLKAAEEDRLGDKVFVHVLSMPGHNDIKYELFNPSLAFVPDDEGLHETLSIAFSRIDMLTTVYDGHHGPLTRWLSGYDLEMKRIF